MRADRHPEAATVQALYYGARRRRMFRIGTYLALIRAMAVGELVQVFYSHSELVPRTQARLARTRNTLRELICHGLGSPQGQAALQRLRAAHAPVRAEADDFRYVLALFMLEPLRWNAAHGGTPLSEAEQTLLLDFWAQVGEAMGIPEVPLSPAQWLDFQQRYEARHWRFTPEGQRLASACLQEVVTLSLPHGSRSLFRQLMRVSMDPALAALLQLPVAAGPVAWALRGWLRWTTP